MGASALAAWGRVYKVIDRVLENEVVVLKFIHPHLVDDQSLIKRFRHEVLIARKLSHRHIVTVYDFGSSDDGYTYLSMEYVEGVSLGERLRDPNAKPFSFDNIVKVLLSVAKGLSYAHQENVIHRDLKPDNIMIRSDGLVQITDFGLAQAVRSNNELTKTGEVVGSLCYMSPEQIVKDQLDTRSDIYSLGIIAFELLTGERPYYSESWYQLAKMQLEDPFPSISQKVPEVPSWYEDFVFVALKKTESFVTLQWKMQLKLSKQIIAPMLREEKPAQN